MEESLPVREVEIGDKPEFAVIWMHGLGADGSDFVPVVAELGLAEQPGVRFIFPDAPFIPVTCNGGYVMRAWYDIISLESTSRKVDQAGIVRACAAIRKLIARENARGIPCARIFLAGFSQGGAVAYTAALTHPEKLAGVIALSTYMPVPQLLTAAMADLHRDMPIFAAHGSQDDVVSPTLGIQARDLLIEQGYRVVWQQYPMPHSVCLEEVEAIGQWLKARLAVN